MQRRKRLYLLVLPVVALTLITMILVACAAPTPAPTPTPPPTTEKTPVLLAAGPPEWTSYAIIVGISDVVNRNSNLDVTVRSTSGPRDIIESLRENRAQLGGPFYDATAAHALHGFGDFEGKEPMESLRILFHGALLRVTFITPEKTGITSFADLKGQKVEWEIGEAPIWYYPLLESVGLDPENDVDWVRTPEEEAGSEGLIMGRIDALESNLEGANLLELSQAVGKLVPLPITEEMWNYVQTNAPEAFYGFSRTTVEPGYRDYLQVTESVPVLAVYTSAFAHADTPEDIAYEYVKAAVSNAAAIRALGEDTAGFSREVISGPSTIPYHKGAIKALKELGFWTDEMQQAHDKALAG